MVRTSRKNITITPEQWTSLDAALGNLEAGVSFLHRLTPDERQELMAVGVKYESFTRETLTALTANPGLLPTGAGADEAVRNWATHEDLLARFQRLRGMQQVIGDTLAVLLSDSYLTALATYQSLTRVNTPASLTPVVTELRSRFKKRAKKKDGTGTAPAPAETPKPAASPTAPAVVPVMVPPLAAAPVQSVPSVATAPRNGSQSVALPA